MIGTRKSGPCRNYLKNDSKGPSCCVPDQVRIGNFLIKMLHCAHCQRSASFGLWRLRRRRALMYIYSMCACALLSILKKKGVSILTSNKCKVKNHMTLCA